MASPLELRLCRAWLLHRFVCAGARVFVRRVRAVLSCDTVWGWVSRKGAANTAVDPVRRRWRNA